MGAYLSTSDLEDLERGLNVNRRRSKKEVYCIYIIFPILLVMFYVYIFIINNESHENKKLIY